MWPAAGQTPPAPQLEPITEPFGKLAQPIAPELSNSVKFLVDLLKSLPVPIGIIDHLFLDRIAALSHGPQLSVDSLR
jgi:hypothetical protein